MCGPARRRATYEDLLAVPEHLVAEALRAEGGRWVLLGTWRDDAVVRAEPFEVFALELSGLWVK